MLAGAASGFSTDFGSFRLLSGRVTLSRADERSRNRGRFEQRLAVEEIEQQDFGILCLHGGLLLALSLLRRSTAQAGRQLMLRKEESFAETM